LKPPRLFNHKKEYKGNPSRAEDMRGIDPPIPEPPEKLIKVDATFMDFVQAQEFYIK
jgi:hypothetical protein